MALIVLDTRVLIAFLDADDPHHRRAVDTLTASGGGHLVLPASAYAKGLGGPLRRGGAAASVVDEALADLGIRIEPITRETARQAAALRAAHSGLQLPDRGAASHQCPDRRPSLASCQPPGAGRLTARAGRRSSRRK